MAPSGAPAAPSAEDSPPGWMACDLLACKTLRDASAQIVLSCTTFGTQLQGVCNRAIEQLPPDASQFEASSASSDAEVTANACLRFVSAFVVLGRALLQLAVDLDGSVTRPLQGVVATLTEETAGRAKHWKRVREQLSALQEQYGKTEKLAQDARNVLASTGAEDKRLGAQIAGLFKGRRASDDAASQQHAAVCALARCEEEVRLSDVSLRRLETDSRERLEQLNKEKHKLMESALSGGAESLRLTLLAAVEAAGQPGALLEAASPAPVAALPASPSPSPLSQLLPKAPPPTPVAEASGEAQSAGGPTAGLEAAGPVDPSLRYGVSVGCEELEIGDLLSSDNEEEDVLARAARWSPGVASASPATSTPGTKARRTLVFQGSSDVCTSAISKRVSLRDDIKQNPKDQATAAAVAAAAAAAATAAAAGSTVVRSPNSASSFQEFPPCGSPKSSQSGTPKSQKVSLPPFSATQRSSQVDDDDDDDDVEVGLRDRPATLEVAEMQLELLPLIAENPQACFERYARRLPERLAVTTETTWQKLQARASEQLLGGHIGKLEFFWITRSGVDPSAETVEGLVCFQFAQGCASNFARILHLSVVGDSAGGEDAWRDVLPSAIFEVRKFLFSTLPIDSLRAVVLAGEDASGRIYVDGDVEVSYERCRFRWFQLTQTQMRRTRSLAGLRREKPKRSCRFLVLHTARKADDPAAPRGTVARLPAMLLRDDRPDGVSNHARPDDVSEAAESAAGDTFTSGFSNW